MLPGAHFCCFCVTWPSFLVLLCYLALISGASVLPGAHFWCFCVTWYLLIIVKSLLILMAKCERDVTPVCCHRFDDRASVDKIYICPTFKCCAVYWLIIRFHDISSKIPAINPRSIHAVSPIIDTLLVSLEFRRFHCCNLLICFLFIYV